jgi:hypothetical protein
MQFFIFGFIFFGLLAYFLNDRGDRRLTAIGVGLIMGFLTYISSLSG